MVLNNFFSIKYVPVRRVFPRVVTCSSAKIITQPPLLCRRRRTQGTSLKHNGRPCCPNSSLLVKKQFALSCIMNHKFHQQLSIDHMMLKQDGRTTGCLCYARSHDYENFLGWLMNDTSRHTCFQGTLFVRSHEDAQKVVDSRLYQIVGNVSVITGRCSEKLKNVRYNPLLFKKITKININN